MLKDMKLSTWSDVIGNAGVVIIKCLSCRLYIKVDKFFALDFFPSS